MLSTDFFNNDTAEVAQNLLGKVIKVRYNNLWLAALIIETEAYYKTESVSHSYRGKTKQNEAMFMSPGTVYMYYSYGKDSLNISCMGDGNAVLIKSGFPFSKDQVVIECMQKLNVKSCGSIRQLKNLCSGQTLLCRSLDLKVTEWNKKQFDKNQFYIEDSFYKPEKIIKTSRLGIYGKEAAFPLRFIDEKYIAFCTRKPKNFVLI